MKAREILMASLWSVGLSACDGGVTPSMSSATPNTSATSMSGAGNGSAGNGGTSAANHAGAGGETAMAPPAAGGARTNGAGSGGAAGSASTGGASGAGSNVEVPGETPNPPTTPTPITKTQTLKVYAHVMPWFDTPTSAGSWGLHWTMNNRDPEVIDGAGRRQIASHYYPLTGPYSSSDPDVIEYQLLLMKYSGIDGVLVDWPGTIEHVDYPQNLAHSNALIERTMALGLEFAVVYEDQNVRIAGDAGVVQDRRTAAKGDMTYARDNYFSEANYIRVNGAPLLLTFGPQTFESPEDWTDIFSVLPEKPLFLTLWYEAGDAGANAGGEYAWIFEHNGHLDEFYQRAIPGLKMGSAYPGYHSFYAEGGWSGPTWAIEHNGTQTFGATLDKALAAGVEYLQLATWNDYGEGTMIEPTEEFGFSLLTTLQERLGVNYGEAELELILRLYQARQMQSGDATRQAELDQAVIALTEGRVADAQTLVGE